MRSRLLLRRSAAAAGLYSSAVLGFLGTVVAAHLFTRDELGRWALVLAATGFFQSFLDLTIEEALVKFGFRYVTREDWGRLRRLFESGLGIKLTGGIAATVVLLILAPFSQTILHHGGLERPLLVGSLLPLVQCWENVGGVAIILRGRYDIRSFFLFVSMGLRLAAIALAAPHGLTWTMAAIVAAQAVATTAVCITGFVAYRRFPQREAVKLGNDRREVTAFVTQSSIATGITSLTTPAATLVLGRVATTGDVASFRVALAPQQGFAVFTSPARLILLTEQTRDWERGTRDAVFSGIRRYTAAMTGVAIVTVPLLLVFAPELVRLLFTEKNIGATNALRLVACAGAIRMVFGWTKSFPVSIGRPNLRIWTHGVEMLVLVPLAGILGAAWGATGAGGAVLASSIAYCVYLAILFFRIKREPPPEPVARAVEREAVAA